MFGLDDDAIVVRSGDEGQVVEAAVAHGAGDEGWIAPFVQVDQLIVGQSPGHVRAPFPVFIRPCGCGRIY